MANQPLIFAMLGAGGLMLVSAVTDSSLADTVKGHPNKVSKTSSLGNLSVTGAGSKVGSKAGATLAPVSTGATQGDISFGDIEEIGKTHGWTGAQLEAWWQVISMESGGRLTAQNPDSDAYGIAQFINGAGEYATYGGNSTTVMGQLTAMANYIAGRYGTPEAALSHEESNHWY